MYQRIRFKEKCHIDLRISNIFTVFVVAREGNNDCITKLTGNNNICTVLYLKGNKAVDGDTKFHVKHSDNKSCYVHEF